MLATTPYRMLDGDFEIKLFQKGLAFLVRVRSRAWFYQAPHAAQV